MCGFLETVFYNSFQCYLRRYRIRFVVINSYEHSKLIESSPPLNPFESFITHCSSDSSVSCLFLLQMSKKDFDTTSILSKLLHAKKNHIQYWTSFIYLKVIHSPNILSAIIFRNQFLGNFR